MDISNAMKIVEAALATPLPTTPEGAFPPPPGVKPLLKDRYEIAEYIEQNSVGFVDTEMMEEYFRGAKGVLRLIPIGEIKEGSADGNRRIKSRETKYRKLPLATMPPLVVENGEVMDGNHRFRVAVAMGATALWCYDIVEG